MDSKLDVFSEAAAVALAFLYKDYGFDLAESDSKVTAGGFSIYWMEFRRCTSSRKWQSVNLNTCPGRAELFLDLAFGWPPSNEPRLSFNCRDLHEIESSEPYPELPASVHDAFGDATMMMMQYQTLAEILQRYGTRFFEFDETLIEDVRVLRELTWQERDRRQKDRKIETAIRSCEWARAVVYLEGLGSKKTEEQREMYKLACDRLKSK